MTMRRVTGSEQAALPSSTWGSPWADTGSEVQAAVDCPGLTWGKQKEGSSEQWLQASQAHGPLGICPGPGDTSFCSLKAWDAASLVTLEMNLSGSETGFVPPPPSPPNTHTHTCMHTGTHLLWREDGITWFYQSL